MEQEPRAAETPGGGRLFGLLVTYRRPDELRQTLARIAAQTRPPDRLLVVDNEASPVTAEIVRQHAAATSAAAEVAPAPENLGWTGGLAFGMSRILREARDGDWIMALDDDDPPADDTIFADVMAFAAQMVARDPMTAAVGLAGSRFDWRRGRTARVPSEELSGPVAVDYLAGNQFGTYRAEAVRAVGTFDPAIFFGFSEGEYGLRLRRAGWSLYAHGDWWRIRRERAGRTDFVMKPSTRIGEPDWRRYYSFRNLIYVLRSGGRSTTAARVILVRGIGKPLANVFVHPRAALGHLRLNLKAARDGWVGRMGRTVEPVPWGPRPKS
jgi:glycosyltransferase involved in cell wall biosynthesis